MPLSTNLRRALFIAAVIEHYARHRVEMPKWNNFGLSDAEYEEVMEVIDTAIANCGGFVPAYIVPNRPECPPTG